MHGGVRLKDGMPLDGIIGVNSEDPINVRIATLVQAQLAAIGMQFTIKSNPVRIWFSPEGLLRNGKATIAGETWVGGSDPEQSLNFRCVQASKGTRTIPSTARSASNRSLTIRRARRSQSQRDRDFDAIQVLIHDDVPAIPLYYEDRLIGASDRVTGYGLNMLWIPVNAANWDAR